MIVYLLLLLPTGQKRVLGVGWVSQEGVERGALCLPPIIPCAYTEPSHLPAVETAGVALRGVCIPVLYVRVHTEHICRATYILKSVL